MSTQPLRWITSSYSSDAGGQCVEVAASPDAVHVRDSKNPDGPAFAVSLAAWSAFLTAEPLSPVNP